MFHFNQWKKQPKQVASFLNKNSTPEEFDTFHSLIERLEDVATEDLKDLFSSKDSFIWFTMFKNFTEFGMEDEKFAEFLREFKNGLNAKVVDGVSYVELDENRGTKDKAVILAKINHLMELMCKHFDVAQDSVNNESILKFVQENVSEDIVEEDIELYAEMLTDLVEDDKMKNVVIKNKPSVIAIIALACAKDIDLDGRMSSLIGGMNFSGNQVDNYLMMMERLEA